MGIPALYYDILMNVLDFYRGDYGQLFHLALVNTEFNRAASNMLYRRVVLLPPGSRLHQLNLRDTGAITSPSNLPSATLPQYAELVVELEVSGYLSPRPPPRNNLHTILADALRKFTSIRSVKFIPATFHEEVFVDSLKLLPTFNCSLRELVLNSSCTSDEGKVSLLTDIKGLRKLALHSPGRAVLLVLPGWLEKSSESLEELHLIDNCGSVTPGVLKAILPLVQARLRAFSLGLSYSITDEDVFAFLSQLQELERLRLRYYWQMKKPKQNPRLPNLKSFTAVYGGASHFDTCSEVTRLCSWVRRVIAASPIQRVHLIAEGGEDWDSSEGEDAGLGQGASVPRRSNPSFDSLVEHLVKKHPFTLRDLHMKSSFISLRAMKSLLAECTALETVHLSVGKTGTEAFSELAPRAPSLHTASFEVQNVARHHFEFDARKAGEAMQRSARLRRVAVNGRRWEGSWMVVPDEGSDLESSFVVKKVGSSARPPWRRT